MALQCDLYATVCASFPEYSSIGHAQVQQNNVNLDEFVTSLPKTFVSPEIKISCSDKTKFDIIERISKKAIKDYTQKNVITLDGVRVKNENGWWLIRASNTEAALVVRFEGKSEKSKKELSIEVQSRLNTEGLTLIYNQ